MAARTGVFGEVNQHGGVTDGYLKVAKAREALPSEREG
jgi:hypothetical protein